MTSVTSLFRSMNKKAQSPSPCNSNYDFSLRLERVRLFSRLLTNFDHNILRSSQSVREVTSTFTAVSTCYSEACLCVNNTNNALTAGEGGGGSTDGASLQPPSATTAAGGDVRNNNLLVENYGLRLQKAAYIFSSEMKKVKEGDAYMQYNEQIATQINKRLVEVKEKTNTAMAVGGDCERALQVFERARVVVEQKEQKYKASGRAMDESRKYKSQVDDMHDKEKLFKAKLERFNQLYDALVQRDFYVMGHTLDAFLTIHLHYFMQLMQVLSCMSPEGPKEVEEFIKKSRVLGKELGVAEDDLVGSNIHYGRANNNNNNNNNNTTTSASAAVSAAGGKNKNNNAKNNAKKSVNKAAHTTVGSAAREKSTSVHNFTSYYRNRRDDDGLEEGPQTARNSAAGGGRGSPRGLDEDVTVEDSPRPSRPAAGGGGARPPAARPAAKKAPAAPAAAAAKTKKSPVAATKKKSKSGSPRNSTGKRAPAAPKAKGVAPPTPQSIENLSMTLPAPAPPVVSTIHASSAAAAAPITAKKSAPARGADKKSTPAPLGAAPAVTVPATAVKSPSPSAASGASAVTPPREGGPPAVPYGETPPGKYSAPYGMSVTPATTAINKTNPARAPPAIAAKKVSQPPAASLLSEGRNSAPFGSPESAMFRILGNSATTTATTTATTRNTANPHDAASHNHTDAYKKNSTSPSTSTSAVHYVDPSPTSPTHPPHPNQNINNNNNNINNSNNNNNPSPHTNLNTATSRVSMPTAPVVDDSDSGSEVRTQCASTTRLREDVDDDGMPPQDLDGGREGRTTTGAVVYSVTDNLHHNDEHNDNNNNNHDNSDRLSQISQSDLTRKE